MTPDNDSISETGGEMIGVIAAMASRDRPEIEKLIRRAIEAYGRASEANGRRIGEKLGMASAYASMGLRHAGP